MPKLVLICGRTCAGKTTGGQILAKHVDYIHVEASTLMREFWAKDGQGEVLDEFAKRTLMTNPARVPATAVARSEGASMILTGLRSPEEVAAARRACADTRLIFVCAAPALRLHRARFRGRQGYPLSTDELTVLDTLHEEMGIGRIEADAAASRIKNEGSLNSYANALIRLMANDPPK